MKSRAPIASLAIVAVSFALSATAAAALPGAAAGAGVRQTLPLVSSAESAIEESFTPAELEDLQTYSDLNGRELSDVAAQFAGLAEFETTVDSLRASIPDSYVAAEWDYGQGTITVRPGAGAEARLLARAHSADTTVVERSMPSELDQQALVAEVAETLAGVGGASLDVYYEVNSNRVVASVAPGTKVPASIEGRLAAAARAAGAQVDVLESPAVSQSATARGGMLYGSGCTGGFIVSYGSPRGISTAAHCTTTPSSYDGNALSTTYSYAGSHLDLRWTKFSSGTSGNTFRYTTNGYRNATSSGNPTVGGVVCKYGRTTGYFCTTVASSGHCNGTYCGLYQTASGSVQPGDSGGPWFYGNKALGITHGFTYVSDPTKPTTDLFTGIGSLSAQGVSVVTS